MDPASIKKTDRWNDAVGVFLTIECCNRFIDKIVITARYLPQLWAREPLSRVTVQTDHMLSGVVGGKRELTLAAVHLYTERGYREHCEQ